MKLSQYIVAGFVCVTSHSFGQMPVPAPTAAPNKAKYTLFNPTPLALRRPYNTDRPSKTDSPFTIDAGAFQIETDAFSGTIDRDNTSHLNVRVRTINIGQTNFKIGLTNSMDFQLISQGWVTRRTSGADFGQPLEQSALGDTTVRLKINLLGNEDGRLVVGFVSSLKIPTNSNNLGNDAYEPGFGIPVNYSLPGEFTLFGQMRVDLLDRLGTSVPRAQWSNPVGISRTILGRLSGYVEFYNALSTGPGYKWAGTLDAGLIYQLSPNCSIDLNAFYGLTDSADDLNVFTGLACRF